MELEVSGFATALALERGCIPYKDGFAIPLGRKSQLISDWTLISKEDRSLAQYFWSLEKYGYVRRRDNKGKSIRMNREMLGLENGDKRVADHINRVRTDNRRENLRVCTQAENCQNQPARRKGTSKHRGVSFRTSEKYRKKPWVANATLNGHMHYIGSFADEEEAAQAAREWRAEHMSHSTD